MYADFTVNVPLCIKLERKKHTAIDEIGKPKKKKNDYRRTREPKLRVLFGSKDFQRNSIGFQSIVTFFL